MSAIEINIENYYPFKVVAIQQVSRSSAIQLVGLLKYSGQSDNTAAQKIYNYNSVRYDTVQ